MGPAALPRRPRQGRPDGVDQPAVRVGGDELNAGQAAGGQVPEEGQPAGAVLGGGDLQAEDLPMPVGVHAGGDQGVHAHHPAALADLQDQRVGGHERVGTGVQRAVPEVGDLGVQVLGHLADLRLREPGDAQALDQLLHPPGRDAQQVAGGDHGSQRPFRPSAALHQPVREVGARPQLRDRHLQGAGSGVEVAGPIAVADVDPGLAAPAVAGSADRVSFGAHEGVDEGREHLAQQVRWGLGQLLVQEVGRVDTARSGHRVALLKDCGRSPRRSRGGRLHVYSDALTRPVEHHSGGRH
jgi:hypothetical protein